MGGVGAGAAGGPAFTPVGELGGRVFGISLPVSYGVGQVNCWVFPDDPVTLVDPGMLVDDGFARLQAGLAQLGLSLSDVRQVVVTHAHPDHWGSVGAVLDASDAVVLGTAEELRKAVALSTWTFPEGEEELLVRMVERLGFPPDWAAAAPAFMKASMADGTAPIPASSTRAVSAGEVLSAGSFPFSARVYPGHAAAHLCLDAPEVFVSGDHVLAEITPVPFLELDASRPEPRRPSLREYLDSLPDVVADVSGVPVLPGHGPVVTDVSGVVASVLASADARTDEMGAALRRHGSVSPYALAREAFPEEAGGDVFLAVAECAGHLDRLVARGHARLDPDGRYTVAGPG